MTMMQKFKILHLENNPVFIEVFENFIHAKLDVDYESVLNTQDAYAWLEKQKPDLLIVDLMLYNDYDTIPGEDFIKEVYKKYPGLKMMALTGWKDNGPRERIGKYVVHYETKAFRPSKFEKQIADILQR
ncbi:response regulator [Desulfococcaceae bacterium HSG7]|nr:response regulator [Desulfococcaceae bacterium HSG7]